MDVTCSTQGIAEQIANWTMLDEEPLSGHALIYFDIKGESKKKKDRKIITTDWATFKKVLDRRIQQTEKENSPETCTKALHQAYQCSTTRKNGSYDRKPYWWNQEMATKHTECTLIRGRLSRLLRRMDVIGKEQTQLKDGYSSDKRALQKLISSSKRKHWKSLCNDSNEDIWSDKLQYSRWPFASP
ncbi:hypothetical protein JTB14_037837 [Gonioctena quinquepunctata]|nr:hypothetical protein JTB14_037837 [Gonioctena quinquepunctata]